VISVHWWGNWYGIMSLLNFLDNIGEGGIDDAGILTDTQF